MATANRPAAQVAFKVQGAAKTRLSMFAYGDDDRIANPGDVLIVSTLGDALSGLVELAILVPGREMGTFARAANIAALEYEANKEWLSQPVTKIRKAASA